MILQTLRSGRGEECVCVCNVRTYEQTYLPQSCSFIASIEQVIHQWGLAGSDHHNEVIISRLSSYFELYFAFVDLVKL